MQQPLQLHNIKFTLNALQVLTHTEAVVAAVASSLFARNRIDQHASGVDPQVINQYCCIQTTPVHYLDATDNNNSIFLYGS